jgi:hypothetical protein
MLMGKPTVFIPARFLIMPDGVIIRTLQEFMEKIHEQSRQAEASFDYIFIHSNIVILDDNDPFLLFSMRKMLKKGRVF